MRTFVDAFNTLVYIYLNYKEYAMNGSLNL